MTLVSSHRMYDVNPTVAEHWQELYDRISKMSGVPLVPSDIRPPAPISALWSRPDMGLAQMCGWPYYCADPRPKALAAPVPKSILAAGKPVYWTEMVVRADSSFESLEDTFGHRLAWTTPGSHSGYNAPRRLLAKSYAECGGPLFSRTHGPVITPRGAIAALLDDRADIAPVDGFYFLLLKRHEPELAKKFRTVMRTPTAPIPLLVASAGISEKHVVPLTNALLQVHRAADCAQFLDALCIVKFVKVDPASYSVCEDWARESEAAGYAELM